MFQRSRFEGQRARGPTDPPLGATAAVALGATVVFYVAIVQPLSGTAFGELFGDRGWVPYGIAFLSLWAGVVLVEKLRRLAREREALARDLLPEALGERITPGSAPAFLAHLDALPAAARDGLVAQRLRRALQHFEARRDAREVVQALESQATADADAVESSYTMVRVFIWAVPILGFIGTVIGIGAAVGGFSDSIGSAVDLDVMKDSIGSVTGGLAVAFDTTLVALVMSIFIMFPASSLQKLEEEFLADVEGWCDDNLVRRLDEGHAAGPPERAWIREAIAEALAPHEEAMRAWQGRLAEIGETLTARVVEGWEKIDEQLRLRQEHQQQRLSEWASDRQREAVEGLLEAQRALLREFRTQLTSMAAEARALQEQGVHRADEQLAGIERLHRRLADEQSAAAELQSAQRAQLASAGEQLAHTLARVRGEVAEARDEGGRELSRVVERLDEVARAAESLQRRLQEDAEAQGRALRTSSERLAGTLDRIDAQLARLREVGEAPLRAVDDLVAALAALRREAEDARRHASEASDAQLEALVARTEEVAARVAEPWQRQLERLEALHDRVEREVRRGERRSAREALRDLLRRT